MASTQSSLGNVYAYSPYGETVALGPDDGNSLQYTGRENDGTGLYYYRARYYDPVLKRFISEDPIGLAGGDVNLRTYVKGNPINFNDALGLQAGGGGGSGDSSSNVCGTDSNTDPCSYYTKRCAESGGRDIYYCKLAPTVCRGTPPIGDWPDCVRRCLQDADKNVCYTPDGKVDPSCTTGAHIHCWTSCAMPQ